MIPFRNLIHLMLRKDVQQAVRSRRFTIWAVDTIEQGLEVLTGSRVSPRGADGSWVRGSFFHKVDAKLTRLAKDVHRFGRPEPSASGKIANNNNDRNRKKSERSKRAGLS